MTFGPFAASARRDFDGALVMEGGWKVQYDSTKLATELTFGPKIVVEWRD